jgi:GTP pyrophosphokinase
LGKDPEMNSLIETVKISGRCKSQYSTMKKLLRDGRLPEEVFDVLGLRVILVPKEDTSKENCARACYRTLEIATTLWKEVPGRLKDYIAKPKKNGYASLHLAVTLSNRGNWSPLMEIQIRTAEMDAMAEGGLASHSLYKGGLTDPEQVTFCMNLSSYQVSALVTSMRFTK